MEQNIVILVIVGLVVLVLIGLPLAWYNKLVRLKQLIRESWGNVDVQLKRRYDLIPNLVNVVKGYAQHERETLDQVMHARNRAEANHDSVGSQAEDERHLVNATKHLLAVVEAYPELKASQHFLSLQRELTNTEDRIAAARRFYNANVRDYNVSRGTFPIMLVAGLGDFPPADFFEVEEIMIRQAPAVSLAQ